LESAHEHAGTAALDQLKDVLVTIRNLAFLRERSRGIFYLSSAFPHF
jgi:hypothetical protein